MLRAIKLNKSLVIGLKLLTFCLVLLVFYWQVRDIQWIDLLKIRPTHIIFIFLVIALMPLNWYFDYLKWTTILKFKDLSHKQKSFKSFVSGIAVSLITPNRLGNFIGRMVWFSGKTRIYIALTTLYSNFSQFLATIILGCLGLLVSKHLPEQLNLDGWVITLLISVVVALLFAYLIAYNWVGFIFKSRQNVLQYIQSFLRQKQRYLLLLSLLRFFVICLQYYFMLCVFRIEEFLVVLPLIAVLFLLTSLTPSLFLGKLVIRESVALFIFTGLYENEILILSASLILWCINLGIPALYGGIILLRYQLK